MKFSKTLLKLIPIIAFLILLLVLLFLYSRNQEEPMTNMEASSILPVLYDSSLTNKSKITDLLGITVNDISYNNILNGPNKDADFIISSIKDYIGSSVTFNTPSSDVITSSSTTKSTTSSTSKPMDDIASADLNTSNTSSKPSPTDATTTKPTTMVITQKPFKDRIKENMTSK